MVVRSFEWWRCGCCINENLKLKNHRATYFISWKCPRKCEHYRYSSSNNINNNNKMNISYSKSSMAVAAASWEYIPETGSWTFSRKRQHSKALKQGSYKHSHPHKKQSLEPICNLTHSHKRQLLVKVGGCLGCRCVCVCVFVSLCCRSVVELSLCAPKEVGC